MELSGLKNKKVLVVEDDATNSELIGEIFDGSGAVLKFAVTGYEAITMVKENDFDIVLMDIQIPGINGYDASKEIKKIKPEVPIIAQTAYAFESDRSRAIESGCIAYLAKPFKKEELLGIVLEYLK